jgi:hypothetical protein
MPTHVEPTTHSTCARTRSPSPSSLRRPACSLVVVSDTVTNNATTRPYTAESAVRSLLFLSRRSRRFSAISPTPPHVFHRSYVIMSSQIGVQVELPSHRVVILRAVKRAREVISAGIGGGTLCLICKKDFQTVTCPLLSTPPVSPAIPRAEPFIAVAIFKTLSGRPRNRLRCSVGGK